MHENCMMVWAPGCFLARVFRGSFFTFSFGPGATLDLYSWCGDKLSSSSCRPCLSCFTFLLTGHLLSLPTPGATFVLAVWLWSGSEGRARTAPPASDGALPFPSPQIEKIMTLIGAGIDFSRDQQYATPGTVPTSVIPREWRRN